MLRKHDQRHAENFHDLFDAEKKIKLINFASMETRNVLLLHQRKRHSAKCHSIVERMVLNVG